MVFGDDVRDLAEKYNVSKASIYRWVNDYEYSEKYNTDNLLTFSQMKRNMDRANQKLHILSSAPCGTNSPLLPRYKYIEKIEDIYGLNLCCEAMNVNKSSYLNYKLRGKRGDTVAKNILIYLLDFNQIGGEGDLSALTFTTKLNA